MMGLTDAQKQDLQRKLAEAETVKTNSRIQQGNKCKFATRKKLEETKEAVKIIKMHT